MSFWIPSPLFYDGTRLSYEYFNRGRSNWFINNYVHENTKSIFIPAYLYQSHENQYSVIIIFGNITEIRIRELDKGGNWIQNGNIRNNRRSGIILPTSTVGH